MPRVRPDGEVEDHGALDDRQGPLVEPPPSKLHRALTTLEPGESWLVEPRQLDADGGAPTSGGPPYQVFELVPARAYGFPTDDQLDPTRWTFDTAPARDR